MTFIPGRRIRKPPLFFWLLLGLVFLSVRFSAAAESHLVATARNLAAKGRFSAALVLAGRACDMNPTDAGARVVFAEVLRDAGYRFLDNSLLEASLKYYEEAISLDPRNAAALFGRGVLLYEGARFEEAIKIFEGLIDGASTEVSPNLHQYRLMSEWNLLAEREGRADEGGSPPQDRCSLCWCRLEEAHWKLEDGRLLCEKCFKETLNEQEELQRLFEQVMTVMEGSFGLTLTRVPMCHLVSRDEMITLAGKNLNTFEGMDPRDLAGLFTRPAGVPALYILRGMPRFETARVIAHECAHAWVSEQCPPDIPLELNEGFAEWAAFGVLNEMGIEEHAARMFLDRGPYGIHFKRLEVIGRSEGGEVLTTLLREGGL